MASALLWAANPSICWVLSCIQMIKPSVVVENINGSCCDGIATAKRELI
jgi:hypothetical protein